MKRILVVMIGLFIFQANLLAQDNNINNKFRLAQSYEQSGNKEKAIEIYNELLSVQPWNNQFLQSLNNLYLSQKDYESSIKLLNEKIQQAPSDINSYGLLGSTYYEMGDNERAFSVWENALAKNKYSVAGYKMIANYAIQNRAFDKAVEYLNRGKSETNDPKIFSFDLANIYALTMNYSKAIDEYCQLLIASPRQLDNIKRRISRLLNTKEFQIQSIDVIKRYAENEGGILFLDLLSSTYIQTKNFTEAFETIKEIDDKKNDNGTTLYSFANNAFKENEFAIASDAYNLLLTDYPNSLLVPRAKIGYAETLKATLDQKYLNSTDDWKPYKLTDTNGAFEYREIVKTYEEIISAYPNTETALAAKYAIALIYKNTFNDFDAAENIFSDLASGSILAKVHPLANEQLGLIAIRKNQLSIAEDYFTSILKNERADRNIKTRTQFHLAKTAFWQNKFEESISTLNKLTEDLSNDFANDAIELSLILATLKTDSLNLSIFAKADLLLEQLKFGEALEQFKLLAENPNLVLLNELAKYRIAQIQLAMNNLPLAIENLEKIADSDLKSPYSDKALYLQANTFLYGVKNIDKAKQAFEKLLELFPNSLYFDKSRQIINGIITKENRNI
jgi:tetratricopeptide (TPR) repeat protein